jgi:transcriptional regulator with XRE-family HTH domain
VTLEPKTSLSYTEAGEQQFATVRERLSERRRELGMSMSELARTIGVSPSMISQIERGQSLPSVETLFALAAALGATVDTFFSAGAAPEPAPLADAAAVTDLGAGSRVGVGTPTAGHRYFVRRPERATIDVHGGVRWERLTPQSLEDVEFLELIYQPGAQSNEHLYRHPGFEMVVVLEGRFEIYVGFERYELEVGDSMAFPSSLPHRYVNPTGAISRAVTTILRDAMPPAEQRESDDPAPNDGLPGPAAH